jgi:hypothetical protein
MPSHGRSRNCRWAGRTSASRRLATFLKKSARRSTTLTATQSASTPRTPCTRCGRNTTLSCCITATQHALGPTRLPMPNPSLSQLSQPLTSSFLPPPPPPFYLCCETGRPVLCLHDQANPNCRRSALHSRCVHRQCKSTPCAHATLLLNFSNVFFCHLTPYPYRCSTFMNTRAPLATLGTCESTSKYAKCLPNDQAFVFADMDAFNTTAGRAAFVLTPLCQRWVWHLRAPARPIFRTTSVIGA